MKFQFLRDEQYQSLIDAENISTINADANGFASLLVFLMITLTERAMESVTHCIHLW